MPQEFFRIESVEGGQLLQLELPEMLDSVEFDKLNESILAIIQSRAGERWIIDLTSVEYMGSAMLGLMVNLRQQIKSAGGRLILCCMPATLLGIFRTCCMERLFVITKNRHDAMRQ